MRAGDLVADPGYLGVTRSGHPVFVEITLRRGRPAEKKQALNREIAQRMSATGLVRAEDLLIVLHENDTADWSFGNGVAQYVEREQKERERESRAGNDGTDEEPRMLSDLKPLVPYLKRYKRGFFWGGVSVVLSNAIWILFPQVLRVAIDDLNHGVTQQKILRYAGLLVAVSLAKGVFLFLTRWIIIGISREIEFDLRNDLFRQLERQSAGYYAEHRTGDIMARMTNDLNAVRMLLGPAIMYSANTVLFSIGAFYLSAAHQPVADAGGAGPAAPGQHPGAGDGPQDSRALRAHSGDVLRDFRAGPGEFLRRAAGARVCAGRGADCRL